MFRAVVAFIASNKLYFSSISCNKSKATECEKEAGKESERETEKQCVSGKRMLP